MSSIHSCNTKPELIVRRYLWQLGIRFRVNFKLLPGHPDIVLKKYRTCIFVNGCFWHGHNCKEFRPPKSHINYWQKKIERNKKRDIEEQKQLAKMGWHVIVVWECELKPKKRVQTLKSLAFTLNHIFLEDHTIRYPKQEDDDLDMAAEPQQQPEGK